MSLGIGGLTIKRLADVKSELEDTHESTFGIGNIDLASDGLVGQQIGIYSEREALVWELLEQVVIAGSDAASGAILDQRFLLSNMLRLLAKPSRTIASDGVTGTLLITGTPGTVVPAGFEIQTSDTEVSFLLEEEVTVPVGGTVLAIFAADEVGPTLALTGTLTGIPTPLAGVTSVTNTADAEIGRLQETDAAFRARRIRAASTVASSTAPALMTAVLLVADVEEVSIIVNRSDSPDVDGRPGHSFEMLVRGGADQDILDAIYAHQPSAIESYGNVTGTVVDPHGDAQPVAFSRPTIVQVWIEVDIEIDDEILEFPANGVEEVLLAIIAYGQERLLMGMDVSPFKIEQTIETPGIRALNMRLSRSINPSSTTPLDIDRVEFAELDSARTEVVRIN